MRAGSFASLLFPWVTVARTIQDIGGFNICVSAVREGFKG